MKGYIMLPCFTVEPIDEGGFGLTCNWFLEKVFDIFFAPFWDGKITLIN